MVKACSRPRTANALAAKAEVGRKSLAARLAGSIPVPGTTHPFQAVSGHRKSPLLHRQRGFFVALCSVTRHDGITRKEKKPHVFGTVQLSMWPPRQESNLYLALRRHPFYPLNYEEKALDCIGMTHTPSK